MWSVQKVFSHIIWKVEIFIEEDTRNIAHRKKCLSPFQSRHLRTSHSFLNFLQLPCHIFLNLINGLKSLSFQR